MADYLIPSDDVFASSSSSSGGAELCPGVKALKYLDYKPYFMAGGGYVYTPDSGGGTHIITDSYNDGATPTLDLRVNSEAAGASRTGNNSVSVALALHPDFSTSKYYAYVHNVAAAISGSTPVNGTHRGFVDAYVAGATLRLADMVQASGGGSYYNNSTPQNDQLFNVDLTTSTLQFRLDLRVTDTSNRTRNAKLEIFRVGLIELEFPMVTC